MLIRGLQRRPPILNIVILIFFSILERNIFNILDVCFLLPMKILYISYLLVFRIVATWGEANN